MIKEEFIEMAEKVYGECNWHDSALAHLEQFAKLVAEHEREACAKVCDRMAQRTQDIRSAALESAAENIRARKDKHDTR